MSSLTAPTTSLALSADIMTYSRADVIVGLHGAGDLAITLVVYYTHFYQSLQG